MELLLDCFPGAASCPSHPVLRKGQSVEDACAGSPRTKKHGRNAC